MAMSNYLQNRLLDLVLRNGSFTKPSTLYFALFTTSPTGAGDDGVEVSGGSYARVAAGTSGTFYGTGPDDGHLIFPSGGTNGRVRNAVAITFPSPTAHWGTVTHIGIFDAATGGNLLLYGALNDAKTINSGSAAPYFAALTLTVSLD